MEAEGYEGWTISGALTPTSRILRHAKRLGVIPENPVSGLERDERPKIKRKPKRVLSRDEMVKLFTALPKRHVLLFKLMLATGMRISEVLGLTWGDIDFAGKTVHVRMQLSREGERVEPKTEASHRAIWTLIAPLDQELREHKLASAHSQAQDLVFCTSKGTGLSDRNVTRALTKAVEAAGLNSQGKPTFTSHCFRHTFASMMIAKGTDPVALSKLLGHARPSTTLEYGHLWDEHRNAEAIRERLAESFGGVL